MSSPVAAEAVEITVVLAWPDGSSMVALLVPAGTGARAALRMAVAAGLDVSRLEQSVDDAALGVFGSQVTDEHPLKAGDRLEVYRPLQQDPMELRRRQARADSSESHG